MNNANYQERLESIAAFCYTQAKSQQFSFNGDKFGGTAMAAIDELIAQVENPELRDRLQQEVSRMNKHKRFGLVFEEHLPECTPLHGIPVKAGSKVARKTGNINELYQVLAIREGKALCLRLADQEKAEIEVQELVCAAQFGEPIYPYLKPMASVCRAPDSDL